MSKGSRRTARTIAAIAATAALLPAGSAAASISSGADASSYVTDGPVYAVAHQPGGDTFLGGDFSHVGPRSGHGLELSAADGSGAGGDPDPGWPALDASNFPEVAGGALRAVVSDQHGGWFIGGDFTSVAGQDVPRLAHILPDGALDTSWVPRPNNAVLALALDSTDYQSSPGNWTLYAGGNFTKLVSPVVQNQTRNFLAAWRVNPATGAPVSQGNDGQGDPFSPEEPLTGWHPGVATNGTDIGGPVRALFVTTLEYDVGAVRTQTPVVIAGGDFNKIGQQSGGLQTNRLAGIWGDGAVDGTGTNRQGQAFPSFSPSATVRAIVAGTPAPPTGAANSQTQSVDVYVGGDFTGFPSDRLRAVQLKVNVDGPNAGNVAGFSTPYTGWTTTAPAPAPNLPVRSLALDEGGLNDERPDTLYVGGDFSTIKGQPRSSLAALAAIPDDQVNSTGCTVAQCPSALRAWDPGANRAVRALALSGSAVYAGGDFTAIGAVPGGQPQPTRNGLAALELGEDPNLGAALPWDAKPAGGGANALALQGDSLYAGGGFFSVGAEPRANLAALDAEGKLVDEFGTETSCEQPSCSAEVRALELAPDGNRLYVGGAFDHIGAPANPGDPVPERDHLAALDLDPPGGEAPGEVVEGWAPDPDNWVLTLDVAGERLYVGGAFDRIGTPPTPGDPQPARSKLAALDHDTGELVDWNPDPRRNGPVGPEPFNVLDIEASCETVYAGGSFNAIGAVASGGTQPTRNSIAALDPDTAAATSWNPNPDGVVRTLAVRGNIVYAGGQFALIGDSSIPNGRGVRHGIGALRAGDGSATVWNPDADYTVRALAVGGDGRTVYAGGSFNAIGRASRSRIAAVQADGVGSGLGNATGWDPSAFNQDPNATSAVHALAATGASDPGTGEAGDDVYAGGEFTDLGPSAQRGYAQFRSVNSTGGPLTEQAPDEPLSCPSFGPPPPPPPPLPDLSPPAIGPLSVSDAGRTLVFTLSKPASIHIDLTGSTTGLKPLNRGRSGPDCVPDTAANRARLKRQLRKRLRRRLRRKPRRLPPAKRHKKIQRQLAKRHCALNLPPRATDLKGSVGENRVPLATLGPLPPGSYRAVVTVRDDAGNQSGPIAIDFTVGA